MASPLVATKLFVPRPRRGLVERGRLTARLAATGHAKLTLVSAPAGFGKTTAVTSWIAAATGEQRVVAWVSLEEGDAEASTFWSYVVAGLQQAVPDLGGDLLAVLQSGQPPTQQLISALVNEISSQATDIDLVLDDYHRADAREVAEGMAYLLDHLPPNLHIVITTRADPDLPLARLRAGGELVEVRARDLRFTEDETAAYLAEVGGLAVGPDDISMLSDRTEGWAAALQLAALSMQGRDDVSGFVAGFAGDDRYVVDYLADEVLSRQGPDVREFLLRTSVLERLSGELCDAVTGASGGRAMLESLDRANLFMVALDDQRHWYRYHHLFGDVLRAHLEADRPGEVAELNRRAAEWYADAGEIVPAVRHALAAGDVDRAAELVEAAVPALGRDRREATLRAWAYAFPDDVVRRRPVLALGLLGGLMQHNDFGPAEQLLHGVERWLPAILDRLGLPPDSCGPTMEPVETGELVYVDDVALARVPATVEMYRAALALVHGDPGATGEHATRARELSGPDDHLARGAGAALSGLACWTRGDLEGAHARYAESVVHLLGAGHESDVLGCTITLADLRIAQGRLDEAWRSYQDGVALALSHGDRAPLRGVSDMHTGLAEIALERGDVETARGHLLTAQELGDGLGLGQNPYRLKAASAVAAESDGDLVTARELLVEAEAVYLGDFSPDVRPLHSRIARIDAARGDLDRAQAWARTHTMAADTAPTYLREHELVTWAEVLLAQHRATGDTGSLELALALLDRLLEPAAAGGRVATVLDILALQALAADAAGDRTDADASLARALELAATEGHVRALARHGDPMLALLERATGGDEAHRARVRAALQRATSQVDESATRTAPSAPAVPQAALVDPLSPRELEVLRLLASDLDGPDIARHLVVSVNTLRTHTKNIYAKLGVTSRRAALRRAHELGLPLSG